MSNETYCSVHIATLEDAQGELVDVRLFCSDGCHRDWCDLTLRPYEGWNGCHEWTAPVTCDFCGTVMGVSPSSDPTHTKVGA